MLHLRHKSWDIQPSSLDRVPRTKIEEDENRILNINMNQNDRKQLEIAHLKLDDMRQDIIDLKNDMEKAHQKTDENLSFIKENMFNPHEGLWAETKLNTQYREDSKKWRYPIGVGFISLIIKNIWDTMTS